MSAAVHLSVLEQLAPATISLPASKSESNRALIIDALSGGQSNLENLSEARDTQTMMRLLQNYGPELDVLDAGTTMRFLTAFTAIKGQQPRLLTGTPRMQQRPIGILANALQSLGATINYRKEAGYPPLEVGAIHEQLTDGLEIRGDVSSQYISALLMIAPALPQGLKLTLTGKVGSKPYIKMTLGLMQKFGVQAQWQENVITVAPQAYKPVNYRIESDWSGASYWFSIVSLAQQESIHLDGLRKDSLQGDIRIMDIMESLGVMASFTQTGLQLKPSSHTAGTIHVNFTDCPDLAQTVAVVCAAKGVKGVFTGLESLRIKETDRIAALQNELAKIGAQLTENAAGQWELTPGTTPLNQVPGPIQIATYEDHRMAMAFAPLATQVALQIEEPSVVQKSYPRFWQDLEQAGFVPKMA